MVIRWGYKHPTIKFGNMMGMQETIWSYSHAMGISSTLWEYFMWWDVQPEINWEYGFEVEDSKPSSSRTNGVVLLPSHFLFLESSHRLLKRWLCSWIPNQFPQTFWKYIFVISNISMNCSKFQYRQPRNFTSKYWYRGFTPVAVPISPINQFSVRWSNDDQGWLRKWIGWTFLGSSRVD